MGEDFIMITRTINDAKNPRWADPTGYRITLDVDFDELDYDYVEFTAVKNTPETPDYAYSHSLFERAVSGEFGPILEFVQESDIVGEDALEVLRTARTDLLKKTDYIESPTKWATLSEDERVAWTEYRNTLRDLPQNVPSPEFAWVYTVDGPNYDKRVVPKNFTMPEKP